MRQVIVEYGVGVTSDAIYEMKRLGTDYFIEEL